MLSTRGSKRIKKPRCKPPKAASKKGGFGFFFYLRENSTDDFSISAAHRVAREAVSEQLPSPPLLS
jgi:hypothetical protein